MVHLEALGAGHDGGILGQRDIEHFAARTAVIMAVLLHVRAKTGGAAFQLDLADESAFDEGVEAVVNGGVGDLGHRALGADENLLGGGMIAPGEDDVIDMLALRRETKTAGAQPLGQVTLRLVMTGNAHRTANLTHGRAQSRFRIILNWSISIKPVSAP